MSKPTDLSARAAAILARLRELERVCVDAADWSTCDCCEARIGPLADIGRTALPALVAIGIAEIHAAQEIIATIEQNYWPLELERFTEQVEDILDAWAPILPSENPRISAPPAVE